MGVYLLVKTYPTTPKKSVLYQRPPNTLPILPAQCSLVVVMHASCSRIPCQLRSGTYPDIIMQTRPQPDNRQCFWPCSSLEIGPPDWRYLILHVARSSPPVPTWLRWTGQCLARLQEGLVNISNGLNNSHPQIEYLDSHSQALQELLETPVFTVSRPRSVFCAPLSGQFDGTGNVTTGTLVERLG